MSPGSAGPVKVAGIGTTLPHRKVHSRRLRASRAWQKQDDAEKGRARDSGRSPIVSPPAGSGGIRKSKEEEGVMTGRYGIIKGLRRTLRPSLCRKHALPWPSPEMYRIYLTR